MTIIMVRCLVVLSQVVFQYSRASSFILCFLWIGCYNTIRNLLISQYIHNNYRYYCCQRKSPCVVLSCLALIFRWHRKPKFAASVTLVINSISLWLQDLKHDVHFAKNFSFPTCEQVTLWRSETHMNLSNLHPKDSIVPPGPIEMRMMGGLWGAFTLWLYPLCTINSSCSSFDLRYTALLWLVL